MSVTRKSFGFTSEGKEAFLYILDAGGITAEVSDFGALLVRLLVPDRDGNKADVVLGFDDVKDYETRSGCFGASVMPVANRTAGAVFTIEGKDYHLPVNEGPNNLHSDKISFRRFYEAETGENSVTFRRMFPDGEGGFPGNRDISVTYTVDRDSIRIDYAVDTDAPTYLSPTNHSYFNLAGQGSGSVDGQTLCLRCSAYTPVGEGSIPTGEIRPVAGTVFDFTSPKEIGRDLSLQDPELMRTGGAYDHNLVIDGWKGDGTLLLFAEASDPVSGRRMQALTDMPGVQLYAAGKMHVEGAKGGLTYGPRAAFCLETQFFPDTPHHDNFPSSLFGPDRPLRSATVYRFSAE